MIDKLTDVARAIDPDCAGLVYAGRAGTFPCSRQGRFQEGGKSWCSQHAPSKVAERRAKADKKYDEKWKAIDFAKLQARNKIWNDAIEAAAEEVENYSTNLGWPKHSKGFVAAIRKLRKP